MVQPKGYEDNILGFRGCQANPNIYYLKIQKLSNVFLALYVDDLLFFNKELKTIERVKELLSQEFEIKNLRELEFFLGIQVIKDRNNRTIKLGQPKYIKEILKWFNMENYKPM